MGVVVVEQNGGQDTEINSPSRIYLDSDGQMQFIQSSGSGQMSRSAPVRYRLRTALASAFLPAGYPSSVTSDYLSFQIWDTIQAMSSYVRGMLSTQAMLAGIGVGNATATPAAAIVQFFYRDAVGLLASVLFAAFQGSSFDAYAKQWRLTADVANDIGLTIELAAPAFPAFFLSLACMASICRAITGMAGGATRMALTQHFALQGNAADIAAKEGSQETAVTLLGMILGLGLVRIAVESPKTAWIAFILLTILHVYANIRAMRCLQIKRLNPERLLIITRKLLNTGTIPTPEEVNSIERLAPPLLLRWGSRLLGFNRWKEWMIVMTPKLSQMDKRTRRLIADHFTHLLNEYENTTIAEREGHFTLVMDHQSLKVYVFLGVNASEPEDVIGSFCTATMATWLLEHPRNSSIWSECQDKLEDIFGISPEKSTSTAAGDGKMFSIPGSFWRKVLEEGGWTCERPALLQSDVRYDWGKHVAEKKSN